MKKLLLTVAIFATYVACVKPAQSRSSKVTTTAAKPKSWLERQKQSLFGKAEGGKRFAWTQKEAEKVGWEKLTPLEKATKRERLGKSVPETVTEYNPASGRLEFKAATLHYRDLGKGKVGAGILVDEKGKTIKTLTPEEVQQRVGMGHERFK